MNQGIVLKWAWQNSELCVNLWFLVADLSLKHGAIRVVVGRVIRSSAEGTRYYHEANNALIFR